jgi:Flp pilus assembly protein TadD
LKTNLADAMSDLLLEQSDERIRPMRVEQVDLRQTIATHYRTLAAVEPDKDSNKQPRLTNLIALSYEALFIAKDRVALRAAEEALSLDPDNPDPAGNKAHALMYLGRLAEARQLYFQNQERSWKEDILSDFEVLTKLGRKHPLMDEVARRMKPSPKSEAGVTGAQKSAQNVIRGASRQ